MTPVFPQVECDRHPGPPRPGFVVCVHLLAGAAVAHYADASADDLGEVLCAECAHDFERDRDDLQNYRIICRQCLSDMMASREPV